MANWTTLKAAIANAIKTNGNQEITGAMLQNTLNSIVNSIGENATFAGIAIPATNPGTPDGPVFYLASQVGTYSNFNGLTVEIGEIAIFLYKTGWVKQSIKYEITEVNISKIFPAEGIDGTNTYDFDTAYAKFPDYLKKKGVVMSFYDENSSIRRFRALNLGRANEWEDISFFSTSCFTTSQRANLVIKKLFIDYSNYSGGADVSEGIYLALLAKNVVNLYGIRINAVKDDELVFVCWINVNDDITSINEVYNGVYVYAEFDWDAVDFEGQLISGLNQKVSFLPWAFNKANDPRGSVTAEKLSLNIGQSLTSDGTVSLMDYEGFLATSTAWPTTDGTSTSPTIGIEKVPNILNLPYARVITITDKLYNGNYYVQPYFRCNLLSILGEACDFSMCFFLDLTYLLGKIRGFYISPNDVLIQGKINWGVTTYTKATGDLYDYTLDISYTEDKKWAFVRALCTKKTAVEITSLEWIVNFVGGKDFIGTKTVMAGLTIVKGLVDLKPYLYYPYSKPFIDQLRVLSNGIPDNSVTTSKIKAGAVTEEKLAFDLYHTSLYNGFYGQVGDSISEGIGLQEQLSADDPFAPVSGTKKATYGYYIAKQNGMRWANYGISGTTLGDVTAAGSDKRGFSKANGRYTQMADGLTHISIFFGWNDSAYGPAMKREEWLQNTYSQKIYWPRTPDLIGTLHEDGTPYATQEQYEACNAVTGRVNNIQYNNNNDYFNALYVGTPDDTTNKTFWGAYNIVLPYLINKYPTAKILLIVSFGCYALLRQCTRDAAHKYGLMYFDFANPESQLFRQWEDEKATGKIGDTPIDTFRNNTLTYDGLHPNKAGYKYMYPMINAKLMSI